MPFTDVFSLSGQYLTYRDFWTLVLGTYAGVVIITGAALSVLATKYTRSPSTMKEDSSFRRRFKAISWSVGFLYALIMFLLALCNGLFVFGGTSIWMFLGALLGIQLVFTLIAIFVPTPYLAFGIIMVSNWYIAGSLFFLIQLPSMFDYASANVTWITSVASAIPLGIMAGISYIQFTNKTNSDSSWKSRFSISMKRWGFWFSILVVVAVSIVLAFFLAGSCITIYGPNADGSWIPFAGTVRWNSRMMRSLSRKSPCPGPGPCHVYLTAGPDLTSSVFVNVHLPLNTATNLTVSYLGGSVVASEFYVPLIDKHDDRQVFSAYLSNLTRGSEISFSLSINGNDPIGETAYFFKTADPNGPVKFVVAGDGGITDKTSDIIDQMYRTKPDVGFVGGDVAYDNGLLSCACVWDDFIGLWTSRRVDDKYLVPISLAVGNHDVGVNDNNMDAFAPMSTDKCNPENIINARPLFFAWFPYETVAASGQVMPICQRTTMHVHSVGTLANLWVLDTAYTVSAADNVDFVNSIMVSGGNGTRTNFAVYHVPLYTANIEDQEDGVYLQEIWPSEIFDKYSFQTCFENHAHAYKRTKPLVNSTVASSGTVYMGDGKMGVGGLAVPGESKIVEPTDSNIFAKTGTEYHFFSVSVSSSGKVHIDAINELGSTFDTDDL